MVDSFLRTHTSHSFCFFFFSTLLPLARGSSLLHKISTMVSTRSLISAGAVALASGASAVVIDLPVIRSSSYVSWVIIHGPVMRICADEAFCCLLRIWLNSRSEPLQRTISCGSTLAALQHGSTIRIAQRHVPMRAGKGSVCVDVGKY